MSVGHRIVETPDVQNVRFLAPDDVPAQATTLREGDRARIKVGRVVLRVGYAKIPADYHDEAKRLLHDRSVEPVMASTLSGSVMEILQHRSKAPFRNRQVEKRLIDAVAYGLAHADRFGGPTRGVVVGDRPDLIDHEFTVRDVRRHQLGHRYGASGGPGVAGSYDDSYEPAGLEGRRTIVTVDTNGWLRVSHRASGPTGFRVLTGDLELVERGPR